VIKEEIEPPKLRFIEQWCGVEDFQV